MTKNTFSKTAFILTIICLMFSSMSTAFGAAKPITDIGGNWAEKQIKSWIDKGLTNGYKDGTFKPNNTITRAEFIALINRSFGYTEKADIHFSDAKPADWYYEDVAKAVKAGYTAGYADQTIGASKKITRQEAAVMIGRLLKLEDDPSGAAFNDSNEFADWSINVIGAVATTQIMKGYEDSTFKPAKPITRAEAVVSLDRAVTYKDATFGLSGLYGPDTGSKTIDSNVTINAAGVTLQNMIINGNLIMSDKIGEGDATLKNVIVKGTTTISGGGMNSVHLNNASLESVIVNKATGSVRVVAEGSTRITSTVVQSNVSLEEDTGLRGAGFQTVKLEGTGADSTVSLKGAFDKLNVAGTKIAVSIPTGTVQVMDVSDQASNSTLNISANVIVASLILNAPIKVTGQGTIQSASIGDAAVDSSFEKPPTLRKDINGVVIKPLAPPAFVSVIANNTGNNVGLGTGDSIIITFDQNTNKPAISAANLNLWFKLSSGHSFGTSLINSDINWNSTGNILTISLTNITGTTFVVGDTISLQAAAGLKNSIATTAVSTAASLASTGSFTSSPVISSVIAANTGNNIDKGIGDSVSITFNQNTNRPQIKAANLSAWLTLSGGHSFGTALTDNNISWNPAGNILTITFSNLTGNTFAIGDTVTVATSANIKDVQLGTAASTSVSPASTGSFTTFLEVKTAVAKNTNGTKDLGVGDTIVLTFAVPTNHPVITAANFKLWFSDLNGHSFGTSANNVNLTWNSTGDILTITFIDVTGVTFTVGDMILIQPAANIRDSLQRLPVNIIVTPASTGSFSDAPTITKVEAANTGNNIGVRPGVGDSVTITFNQNTNKPVITGSTINTMLKLSSGHSFGTHLANSDIVWNSASVLTITFSNLTGNTFNVGDRVTVDKTANIKDENNSALESVAVSPVSTGSFSSGPVITSIVAMSTGTQADIDPGDSVVITFNQKTNRPAVSPANVDAWFTLNDGHTFGTNTSIGWNPDGNALTITFRSVPVDHFIIGDRITISASANLKDSLNSAPANTAVGVVASTGSFSRAPKIISVVAANDGNDVGVNARDTLTITFDLPTNTPDITANRLRTWFNISNSHSLGTTLSDSDATWDSDTGKILTITFSDVTGTTFVPKADSINVTAAADIRDITGDPNAKVGSTAVLSSGTFTSAPKIIEFRVDNTVPDGTLGVGDIVTIAFDQLTNKPAVTPSLLKSWFILKDNTTPNNTLQFTGLSDTNIHWTTVDGKDCLVFTLIATVNQADAFRVFDTDISLSANGAAAIKDITRSTLPASTQDSVTFLGNF